MTAKTSIVAIRSLGLAVLVCVSGETLAADTPLASSAKDVKWGAAQPFCRRA